MKITANIQGLSNTSKRWLIAVVAILLLAGAFFLQGWYYSAKIKKLSKSLTQTEDEYTAAVAQAQALEISRDILQISFDRLTNELILTRANANKKIKEAGVSAYHKKMSISDADLAAAWSDYMYGVRRRNSERK